MDKLTDLEDMDVLVRRRRGRYLASMPQVGLYATAASLSQAIDALEVKKKSLLEELTAAGALGEIRVGYPTATVQPTMLPALALFAAKAVIVMVLFLAIVGYSRFALESEVARFQAPKLGGAAFWADLQKNIARAAEPNGDLSPEKKQALLNDIHIIVDRWRPFVREGARLFDDRDAPSNGNP